MKVDTAPITSSGTRRLADSIKKERNDACPSHDQHGHASPYDMCFHSLSVVKQGVAISLLLGVIHVPSLQITSVFIIEELMRNLQHGVPHFWVNVLNFESSPPLGAKEA